MPLARRSQAVLVAVAFIILVIVWLRLQSAPNMAISSLIELDEVKRQTKHLKHSSDDGNNNHISTPSIGQLDSVLVFLSSVNDTESKLLTKLFSAVSELLRSEQIPYFLYRGSLIGAVRHHGRIPWDDDFDVAVSTDMQQKLISVFKQTFVLSEGINITLRTNSKCWKLHKVSDRHNGYTNEGHDWPFVDVWFYKENVSHIWDNNHSPVQTWMKRKVFPLVMLPFNGELQPVPCDVEQFINKTLVLQECISGNLNHRTGHRLTPCKVACSQLYPYFPFVQTKISNDEVVESRMVNNTVLDQHVSKLQNC